MLKVRITAFFIKNEVGKSQGFGFQKLRIETLGEVERKAVVRMVGATEMCTAKGGCLTSRLLSLIKKGVNFTWNNLLLIFVFVRANRRRLCDV